MTKVRGQKPHIPTPEVREIVRNLVIHGATQDTICSVIGVSKPTLNKHYRTELDNARAIATSKVIGKLMQLVDEGVPSAIFFFLKARGQWRENNTIDTPDGSSITITINKQDNIDEDTEAKQIS